MKDDEPLRFKSQWLWALFPAFLGVIIVALLAEFKIIEFDFSINDVDTFIILMGLLLTIGLSSILISREAMRRRAGAPAALIILARLNSIDFER